MPAKSVRSKKYIKSRRTRTVRKLGPLHVIHIQFDHRDAEDETFGESQWTWLPLITSHRRLTMYWDNEGSIA